jgi:hypothetical protein
MHRERAQLYSRVLGKGTGWDGWVGEGMGMGGPDPTPTMTYIGLMKCIGGRSLG